MADNLGIDMPAGDGIARITFAPTDDKNRVAELDGPVKAIVLDDLGTAEVAVGGTNGLTVDIKIPAEAGSLATVSVKGDADKNPDVDEVIETIITLRRLAEPVGKAVTLGGKPENVQFLPVDQFGQFEPVPAARRR